MDFKSKLRAKGINKGNTPSTADSTESENANKPIGAEAADKALKDPSAAAHEAPKQEAATSAQPEKAPSPTGRAAPSLAGIKPPNLSNALGRAKLVSEKLAAVEAPKVKPKSTPRAKKEKEPEGEPVSQLSALERIRKLQEMGAEIDSVFPDNPWEESNLPDFDAESHLADLKALEQSLIDDVPELPVLMGRIHRNLSKYDDLAYILNEQQIGVIVAAFARRKGIEIVAPTKAKGSVKGRSIASATKDMTVDEIMGLL
jgi:hypothetical protein